MKAELEYVTRGDVTAAIWPAGGAAPAGFGVAFSTRIMSAPGFVSQADFARTGSASAQTARALLCEALDVSPDSLAFANQIHSANVVAVISGQTAANGFLPNADALVSDEDDIALAVFTADCAPILLADASTGAMAAIHAGWRGMTSGIIENAVRELAKRYGSRAKNATAWLGPIIGPCCYEVGGELIEKLSISDRAHLRDGQSGRPSLDIGACCRARLEAAGVAPQNIFDAGVCTKCRPDLFASYRGGVGGSNISMIYKRLQHGGI